MMHARRGGFTLIEMMIVIVMISIITALAMPHIDYTQMRLDNSARSLRTALQKAQARAVSEQHDVDIAVDLNDNELRIIDDWKNDFANDTSTDREIGAPLDDGIVIAQPTLQLSQRGAPTSGLGGAALQTITTANGNQYRGFAFRPDGAVTSDVQIYIKSKRGKAQDWRSIDLLQSTGRTDWYKFVGGAWVAAGF